MHSRNFPHPTSSRATIVRSLLALLLMNHFLEKISCSWSTINMIMLYFIVFSCLSQACEKLTVTGQGITNVFHEYVATLSSQLSGPESGMASSTRPIEILKSSTENSPELEITPATLAAGQGAQKTESNNAGFADQAHKRLVFDTWSYHAQSKKARFSLPQHCETWSTETNDGIHPSHVHPESSHLVLECEQAPLSLLKSPSGISRSKELGYPNHSISSDELFGVMGGINSISRNLCSGVESGREMTPDVDPVDKPHASEDQNHPSRQLLETTVTVPFFFQEKRTQAYFENLHRVLYNVKNFVYSGPVQLKLCKEKITIRYGHIWRHATINGKLEVEALRLPSIFFALRPQSWKNEPGKLKGFPVSSDEKFHRLRGWIIHTLPAIIHDVKVVCTAFPRLVLDSKMAVEDLQRDAWHFFRWFAESIERVYAGAEDFKLFSSKSNMPYADMVNLIDTMGKRSLRNKGYTYSFPLERLLFSLWLSFQFPTLYDKTSKGNGGGISYPFVAILNHFYEAEMLEFD